jgi:hypothetical protein
MADACPICSTPLAADSRFCHKCGVPLTGEAPTTRDRSKWARVARLLAVATWLACVVACILIPAVDIESIVATGPIIAALGVVTGVMARKNRLSRTSLIGFVHAGFCLFIFLLIVTLRWGPPQARHPVLIIGGLYTLACIPLTIWAWFEPSKERSPWVCAGCGYLLRGLTEPRCPECGTAFDPQKLVGPPPTSA